MRASAHVRRATGDDVAVIVALLADDMLGAARDGSFGSARADYMKAFADIEADPNNELYVVEDNGAVVGCFQLTFIPGLSRKGSTRCQIEAVRIASHRRGQGLGAAAMAWAIERARQRECALVQLTSDANRVDAHRFYERLGFTKSHAGFKLKL
jgi:GNAT superfamily N-acetyltransferase